MDQGLIPKRYAKALYLVAKDKGLDKDLYLSMCNLSDAFASHPEMNAAMQNPFIGIADKKALINTAIGASKGTGLVDDFVKLLVDNGRIGLMRDIAIAYEHLYREECGIYRVHVTSAKALAPAEEQRLKALIEKNLQGGTMEYSTSVDPDLIGGFTVNIDNRRLDASVRNELEQLRLTLLKK